MENLFGILIVCVLPLLLCIAATIAISENRKRKKIIKELEVSEKRQEQFSTDTLFSIREKWLERASGFTVRNETEVEFKLVGPLLSFLDFSENSIDIRKSISVQVGRNSVQGQADWVVWNHKKTKVILVVEAKGPNQVLDQSVKAQARSYATAPVSYTHLTLPTT